MFMETFLINKVLNKNGWYEQYEFPFGIKYEMNLICYGSLTLFSFHGLLCS